MLDLLDGVSEDEVLVIMNKENTEAFDVYRLNIKTSDLELIVKNPGNVINWATDHNGVVRVAFTKDGTNDSVYYRDTEEQSFKKIITTTFKEKFFSIVFTSDNKDIYALSDRGRDKIALVKYNINEDKEDEILFQHQDVDVDSFSYSKKHGTLSSVDYYTWKLEHVFFDKERKAIFDYISTQLPSDMVVEFITSDQDESLFIIKAYSDKVPNSYYLYNDKTKELKKLADSRPWLDSDNMSDTKPIQYKSRDALTINGYLTLPAGKDPKKLPVVVVVHGGPEARDTWGFDPEIQFLANRGYAVLQVNYRGSTGYGRSFWESSFKQWGLKMQDDLTDGVQWLINQGVADPSRIAIYGGSYGGYAALAGVTFTPDLYACAVDYVGVSNFFTFFEAAPAYWKPILEMMYEEMGDPVKDKELLTQISPLFHVDKIKVPVFIAQGAQDPRVNKKESDQIVQALKNRHIKVEYMVKMDEGHGFLNEENKLEFYKRAEKFLGQCLAAPKN
jgi:dipeptidyl aminopeptidase/acylaminoacyl peptidase